MTVSGTITYRTNRNEIIKGALRLLSAYDFENTTGPSANQITFAAEALQLMLKQWGAIGLQLWERRYAVIFPQYNQSVYVLGSPGPAGDHATFTTPLGVAGFVQTTLAEAASEGDLAIEVESISSNGTVGVPAVSMATTNYIGVELDSGELQWTTINGAPSGTTVTLSAALTGDAESGNTVYSYVTKLIRPLQITDAFVRQVGQNDVPVNLISRDIYNRFGQKIQTNSTPSQLYYDNQENTGYVYIYPGFSTVDQLLYIEIQKPIDDITSADQDYDLPQEWGGVLKYNLALALAPEYEVPTDKFKQIKFLADESMNLVKNWDQETESVFLQPNQLLMMAPR